MDLMDLIQYSFGTASGILGQVTADLTQEQTDWVPPGIANSIGSLYWHMNAYLDHAVHDWGMGKVPLSYKDGWRSKVLVGQAPELAQGEPPVIQDVKVDLSTLRDYAKVVQEAAQSWVSTLTPADLERKVETPVGELSLAQMIELYIIWHINIHCGEIAALKGCQGVLGYPF
jgi:hypothetical protein